MYRWSLHARLQVRFASYLNIEHSGCPLLYGAFIRSSISRFVTLVKEKNPYVITTHCIIHLEALASKTLTAAVKVTLDSVIQIINYIKGGALNTRLICQLYRDTDSSNQASFSILLYVDCKRNGPFSCMTSWKRWKCFWRPMGRRESSF